MERGKEQVISLRGATGIKQKRRKKRAKRGEPQRVTRAVTHIRLLEANAGKLAALDALASVYLSLCQEYVTLFCTTEQPNAFRDLLYATPLSARWHRVAIQQAAGIAQSWRTNQSTAYQDHLDALAEHREQQAEGTLDAYTHEPTWQEWNVPHVQFAYEQLSVTSMKFKARAQNAYLRASNLAHIPKQLAWNATKRGVLATPVKGAYSSQECSACHFTHKKNRSDQRTFRCRVCGYEAHADFNASVNISRRVGDTQLRACSDRTAIKALLMKRHEQWKEHTGKEDIAPVKRKKRRASAPP